MFEALFLLTFATVYGVACYTTKDNTKLEEIAKRIF